ncbi:hypothetical protein GCM10011390_43920 [Aureimonas endophytica]|uniref:Uncharacterized protein n=1 Tax=Aureimonas endophytica TaxID=2027858 RepID=A0A916ZZF1_9HYPH|nr:hypothetical protein [Aureimonas endophytica]GGE19892.1 hypothetical protein GCM10011390_43920 [Aureimonas endophytica]
MTTPPQGGEEAFFSSLCLTGTTTEELTDRVRTALGSYERYAGMRQAARAYAGERDWLSIAARYRAVLD